MVPEPGQLVHVRQRPFVVESVLASSGLPDVLRQDGLARSQHLVTLSSIEDDALDLPDDAQPVAERVILDG